MPGSVDLVALLTAICKGLRYSDTDYSEEELFSAIVVVLDIHVHRMCISSDALDELIEILSENDRWLKFFTPDNDIYLLVAILAHYTPTDDYTCAQLSWILTGWTGFDIDCSQLTGDIGRHSAELILGLDTVAALTDTKLPLGQAVLAKRPKLVRDLDLAHGSLVEQLDDVLHFMQRADNFQNKYRVFAILAKHLPKECTNVENDKIVETLACYIQQVVAEADFEHGYFKLDWTVETLFCLTEANRWQRYLTQGYDKHALAALCLAVLGREFDLADRAFEPRIHASAKLVQYWTTTEINWQPNWMGSTRIQPAQQDAAIALFGMAWWTIIGAAGPTAPQVWKQKPPFTPDLQVGTPPPALQLPDNYRY